MMAYPVRVEYADARKMRQRNTRRYRVAHLPIWIWVFFLAPGPLTFDLFARGGSRKNLAWLLAVIVGCGRGGVLWPASRMRAATLYPALYRRQAEPALPQDLL